MNKQFTRKLFISIFTCLILLTTNNAFACVDNWTTVGNGDWSTSAIWSVNGGAPQTGPPPPDACIFIVHTVTLNGSYTLPSTAELKIGITGNLLIKGDFTNQSIIINEGQFTVENTIYNTANSTIFNYMSGIIDILNDVFNQDCSSLIYNKGIINISNSFYNSGKVDGEGGMYNVVYDAKNTSCCAVFAGTICVMDKDGKIDNKCGTIETSVSQETDCTKFLPIELLFFKGIAENNRVLLSWATASETNNDYFVVEKSLDSHDFTPVLKINGAGNSNQVLNYSAYDSELFKGYTYYRLKQVDYDEKYTYSEIIVVANNDASSKMDLHYVPSSNSIQIDFGQNEIQEGFLEIFSMQGQKIFHENIVLDKPSSQLPIKPQAGVYIAKMTTSTKTITKKLVIQ